MNPYLLWILVVILERYLTKYHRTLGTDEGDSQKEEQDKNNDWEDDDLESYPVWADNKGFTGKMRIRRNRKPPDTSLLVYSGYQSTFLSRTPTLILIINNFSLKFNLTMETAMLKKYIRPYEDDSISFRSDLLAGILNQLDGIEARYPLTYLGNDFSVAPLEHREPPIKFPFSWVRLNRDLLNIFLDLTVALHIEIQEDPYSDLAAIRGHLSPLLGSDSNKPLTLEAYDLYARWYFMTKHLLRQCFTPMDLSPLGHLHFILGLDPLDEAEKWDVDMEALDDLRGDSQELTDIYNALVYYSGREIVGQVQIASLLDTGDLYSMELDFRELDGSLRSYEFRREFFQELAQGRFHEYEVNDDVRINLSKVFIILAINTYV